MMQQIHTIYAAQMLEIKKQIIHNLTDNWGWEEGKGEMKL